MKIVHSSVFYIHFEWWLQADGFHELHADDEGHEMQF